MSPLGEVALVVQRELARNLRSAKGALLGLLCLLGSVGATVLAIAAQRVQPQAFAAADATELRRQVLTGAYDAEIAKAFAGAPTTSFGIALATVGLSWILSALVGFDAVSAELQHRSLRYWIVRGRRSSFFLGKALGVFAVVATFTLAMHVASWIVLIARGGAPLGVTLDYGVRLWLVTVPISFAWCALTAFVSALFRSPILALLGTCAAAFAIWLASAIGRLAEVPAMLWIYPGHYDRLLLSPERWPVGVLAALGFSLVFLVGGALVLERRDA